MIRTIAAAGLLLAAGAQAATPYREKIKCPLGGQEFEVTRTASMSTFGQRLDGKPRTSWIAPFPLEICPNGFIIFDKPDSFTAERLERIAPIIADPAYRKVLAEEPNYAALAYVLERLGEPGENVAYAILQASWQVDDDADAYRRYQRRYIAAAEPLLAAKGKAWSGYPPLSAWLINARRVTGDFDGAAKALAALDLSAQEPKRRENWQPAFDELGKLIAARDARIDPSERERD
jgi:hypothetical protein